MPRVGTSNAGIIFFDEIDSLLPRRGNSNDSSSVSDRMIAQFLTEMDYCMHAGNIYIIGATNRLDLLDPSILQPGRFDVSIYLGVDNSTETRLSILKSQTRKMALSVSLEDIEKMIPDNYTGADIYAFTSTSYSLSLNRLIDRLEGMTRDMNIRECRKYLDSMNDEDKMVRIDMSDITNTHRIVTNT